MPLDPAREARIVDLLSRMTLDEKVGQLDQSTRPEPERVRAGGCGSWILAGSQFAGNESGPRFSAEDVNSLQREALASRLGNRVARIMPARDAQIDVVIRSERDHLRQIQEIKRRIAGAGLPA